MPADAFTFSELRISLTAFAIWLANGNAERSSEPVELVDLFIAETT